MGTHPTPTCILVLDGVGRQEEVCSGAIGSLAGDGGLKMSGVMMRKASEDLAVRSLRDMAVEG